MWTKRLTPVALVFAVLALSACGQRETFLTVHASATTRATPDLAIVTVGVVARGATAAAAQTAQGERMTSVMEAVRAAGVVDEDVQTVGYALDPVYTYPRGGPPRITGYQSRNVISIRVKDLNAVSRLIDATVADGANELQGIQFTFQDNEASRDAARAQAVQTARSRAESYAEAADMKIARVVSITEPGGAVLYGAPPPMMDGYAARNVSVEQSAGAQIAPGQLDAQSSVTVVYELR